ncbi:MAG: hypothetical protein MZW92_64655 [Comamonadaceae bacterium]|nr:hypothetical protein [Comamonadaceae bacterium]
MTVALRPARCRCDCDDLAPRDPRPRDAARAVRAATSSAPGCGKCDGHGGGEQPPPAPPDEPDVQRPTPTVASRALRNDPDLGAVRRLAGQASRRRR